MAAEQCRTKSKRRRSLLPDLETLRKAKRTQKDFFSSLVEKCDAVTDIQYTAGDLSGTDRDAAACNDDQCIAWLILRYS